jgi:amino acid adenylation domain-containing protein
VTGTTTGIHAGPLLPLTPQQLAMWHVTGVAPGTASYQLGFGLRLRGRLRTGVLCAALADVQRRHPALRIRFRDDDGAPRQQVLADPLPDPVVEDAPAGTGREHWLRAGAEEELRRPFDPLDRLFRIRLWRLAADEHVLWFTAHHAVFDGWSQPVLVRDLAEYYAARVTGRPARLPARYTRFDEYARVTPAEPPGLTGYAARFADLPRPVELPTDRPRSAVPTFAGGEWPLTLPDETAEKTRGYARTHRVSPFMVLLAALGGTLARHGGGRDLVLGVPVANRYGPAEEEAVGLFANTVALRLDLRGDPTFRDLVRRTRRAVLDGLAAAPVPFSRLVEELRLPRDPRRHPLFQVMFVVHHFPGDRLAWPDLAVELVEVDSATAKFDLWLSLTQLPGGGFTGVTQYDTALFEPATVQRLTGHWYGALAAGLADPDAPMSTWARLDRPDREAVLALGTGPAPGPGPVSEQRLPDPVRLHDLVRDAAARHPDAVAVAGDDATLTYTELTGRAYGLAHRLRAAGCGPESVVGVLLDRGAQLPVALLGILCAGAAYLPLDPDHPDGYLARLLTDARVRVVVADAAGAARLAGTGVMVVPAAGEPAAAAPPDGAGPDCPAYVIYTSGSTGTPKGVMVPHAAIANRIRWMQRAYRLTPDDTVLQKTPVGFDVSVWEFFWPLSVGARLRMLPPGGHRDPTALRTDLSRHAVTTAHFVPSMLRLFLDELPPGQVPPALRRVICSGEVLDADLAARATAALPGVELHNLYGPTEAAVDVTAGPVRPDPDRVPIGRPIDNTQVLILDDELEPVPVGTAGELYLAGACLARGYLGRPDLTADRWLPHPHARPGARLYRTGDLGRWRPDGAVDFLGRVDRQVKVRGYRIEPDGVAAALRGCPGVRDAVVDVRGGTGAERLLAWVVPEPGAALDPARVLTHARAQLPGYAVPAHVVPVDRFPTTVNGKTDRAALPDPAAATVTAATLPPPGTLQRLLVEAVGRVLGTGPAPLPGNFFALGGDSIRAATLVRELAVHGVRLTVREIFEHPDLADLARIATTAPDPRLTTATSGAAPVAGSGRARLLLRPPADLARRIADVAAGWGIEPAPTALPPVPVGDIAAAGTAALRRCAALPGPAVVEPYQNPAGEVSAALVVLPVPLDDEGWQVFQQALTRGPRPVYTLAAVRAHLAQLLPGPAWPPDPSPPSAPVPEPVHRRIPLPAGWPPRHGARLRIRREAVLAAAVGTAWTTLHGVPPAVAVEADLRPSAGLAPDEAPWALRRTVGMRPPADGDWLSAAQSSIVDGTVRTSVDVYCRVTDAVGPDTHGVPLPPAMPMVHAVVDGDELLVHANGSQLADAVCVALGTGVHSGHEIDELLPPLPMQREMLRRRTGDGDPGRYVIVNWMPVRGTALDAEAVRAAWRTVLDRHPCLRASFVTAPGQPALLRVHRRAEPDVAVEDHTHLDDDQRRRRRQALQADLLARGFPSDRAPQSMFAVCRTGPAEQDVLYAFTYMLQDGWSYAHIVSDFLHALDGRYAHPARLPYPRYLEWVAAHEQTGPDTAAVWRRLFDGWQAPAPVTASPETASSGPPDGPAAVALERVLPAADHERLRRYAARVGVTESVLVHAAWSAVWAEYTGSPDAVVGVVHSGRNVPLLGVERMVGFANNFLPVRLRLDQGPPRLADWLRAAQAVHTDVQEVDRTPHEAIRTWLNLPTDHPIFDSYLVFENFPLPEGFEDRADRAGFGEVSSLVYTGHAVRVQVFPLRSMYLTLVYGTGQIGAADADRLADRLVELLRSWPDEDDRPRTAVPGLDRWAGGELPAILPPSRPASG